MDRSRLASDTFWLSQPGPQPKWTAWFPSSNNTWVATRQSALDKGRDNQGGFPNKISETWLGFGKELVEEPCFSTIQSPHSPDRCLSSLGSNAIQVRSHSCSQCHPRFNGQLCTRLQADSKINRDSGLQEARFVRYTNRAIFYVIGPLRRKTDIWKRANKILGPDVSSPQAVSDDNTPG
jgi:hypothetical protein